MLDMSTKCLNGRSAGAAAAALPAAAAIPSTPRASTASGVFRPAAVRTATAFLKSKPLPLQASQTLPLTSSAPTPPPAHALVGNAVVPVQTIAAAAPLSALSSASGGASGVARATSASKSRTWVRRSSPRKSSSLWPAAGLRATAWTEYPSSTRRRTASLPTLPEAPTTATVLPLAMSNPPGVAAALVPERPRPPAANSPASQEPRPVRNAGGAGLPHDELLLKL
mmetsp:Transcript_73715/g.207696  ORF Transcript_73715/g.207696 Transcript_73715/m.207696 type:complete len:225 (+) Transcript_73715:419-1093(+)